MLGVERTVGGILNLVGKGAYYGVRGAWAVAAPAAEGAMQLGFPLAKAATLGGIQAGSRVGAWALRHPEAATIAGAAGLGVAGAMALGAEESSMTTDQAAQLAVATGGPSTGFGLGMASTAFDPGRMAFQDSAHGLTLGLWRGRHG